MLISLVSGWPSRWNVPPAEDSYPTLDETVNHHCSLSRCRAEHAASERRVYSLDRSQRVRKPTKPHPTEIRGRLFGRRAPPLLLEGTHKTCTVPSHPRASE